MQASFQVFMSEAARFVTELTVTDCCCRRCIASVAANCSSDSVPILQSA
jgi:hypothetical protein